MSIHTSTIRRGIQLYKTTSFEFPLTQDEKDELGRIADSNSLNAILNRYEEAASQILRDAGLPDHMGPFLVHEDGPWQEFTDELRAKFDRISELSSGETVQISLVTQFVRHKPLTLEWRAAQILKWCDSVRHYISKTDASAAAYAAISLQDHVTKALVIDSLEPDVIRGRNNARCLRKAAQTHNKLRKSCRAKFWENWQQVANQIWERNSQLSKMSVAEIVRQQLGIDDSVNTIRRRIAKKTGEAH